MNLLYFLGMPGKGCGDFDDPAEHCYTSSNVANPRRNSARMARSHPSWTWAMDLKTAAFTTRWRRPSDVARAQPRCSPIRRGPRNSPGDVGDLPPTYRRPYASGG